VKKGTIHILRILCKKWGLRLFSEKTPKMKKKLFVHKVKKVYFLHLPSFPLKDRKVASQDPAGQIGLLDQQR
jgi:hypothetical protein